MRVDAKAHVIVADGPSRLVAMPNCCASRSVSAINALSSSNPISAVLSPLLSFSKSNERVQQPPQREKSQRPALIDANVSAARGARASGGNGYTELTLISQSTKVSTPSASFGPYRKSASQRRGSCDFCNPSNWHSSSTHSRSSFAFNG